MCRARAVCAKKQCSEFVFKCSMGPGLGPQGKLEGLCVGSFNNCFGKFVPFFNCPGKKAIFIYMLALQPAYKFKWVVIFLFGVSSVGSNLELLLPGCHLRSCTSLLILFVSFSVPMMPF